MVVEPHWAFSQRALAIDLDCEKMYARAQPTVLAGRNVQSLTPGDLLLTLAIHGASITGSDSPGFATWPGC